MVLLAFTWVTKLFKPGRAFLLRELIFLLSVFDIGLYISDLFLKNVPPGVAIFMLAVGLFFAILEFR